MKSNFNVVEESIYEFWGSSATLPKEYKRIIKSGFLLKKEHFFLKRLFNTSYFNWDDFSSKSMCEYFVNSIYLDVDNTNLDELLECFIILTKEVYQKFIEVDKLGSNVTIVLISNENNAELKFFINRDDEPAVLVEDLDEYSSEKILILDRHSIEIIISKA